MSEVRRREFITLLGGASVWPLAARAQQPDGMRRIGVLVSLAEDDPETKARLAVFRQGLEKRGWSEGRNVLTIALRRTARRCRCSRKSLSRCNPM
jgi:putative ABC transport system substrate-binding protein